MPKIELHNCDCLPFLKTLPDKSVDLIVTDPPYGINYNNNGDLAQRMEKAFGGDISRSEARPIINDGEEESMKLFEQFLIVACEKLLKGGACCCCCGGGGPRPLFAKWALLMDKYIGFNHAVVWDKGGLGLGIHYRRNYELILIAQKGQPAHRWNGGNKTPNVWRINKIIPSATQHPTEKPTELMQRIIEIHSNPNDVVLDPFMGRGSTGVAAKRLNRSFIGCEISPEWFQKAEARINSTEWGLFK